MDLEEIILSLEEPFRKLASLISRKELEELLKEALDDVYDND